MTTIEKIRAEIERRMDKHWEGLPDADAPEDDWTHNELCELGAYKELEHLETFLSDLEKSEKPIFPNDLEEAAVDIADSLLAKPKDYALSAKADYWNGAHDGVIAGAKWQKEQMLKDYSWLVSPCPNIEPKADIIHTTDTAPVDGKELLYVADKSYKIGWRDCKEQMLNIIESRISEIIGDAQPKPAMRIELEELITKIKEEKQ